MIAALIAFLRDRSGVSAIEYGLIAALIGVAIVGGATLVGDELIAVFGVSGGAIESTATNLH